MRRQCCFSVSFRLCMAPRGESKGDYLERQVRRGLDPVPLGPLPFPAWREEGALVFLLVEQPSPIYLVLSCRRGGGTEMVSTNACDLSMKKESEGLKS